MLRLFSARLFVAALLLVIPLAAQQPATGQADDQNSQQNSADQGNQAEQASQTDQKKDSDQNRQPSKLKKLLKRAAPNCAHVGAAGRCWSESEREKEAKQKQQQQEQEQQAAQQAQIPPNQPAPHSSSSRAGDSSSRDSIIDLAPPPGDDISHEGAGLSDVEEFHPWDPHRAMKDVEVGDFYFKRGNYSAAESRYAEALQWKPNDAIATFHLAQSQEKLGKVSDALKNYQGYLKILPQGEFAEDAKKSIERLTKLQSKETPPTSPPAQKRP